MKEVWFTVFAEQNLLEPENVETFNVFFQFLARQSKCENVVQVQMKHETF